MKKESIMYGIIGILSGVIITGFAASQAVNNNNTSVMGMMGIHSNSIQGTESGSGHMGMSMASMSGALIDKSGDDFDKTFISEMIDHHQGAIDMATLAKKNAKHEEIKKLADDIITAQTKEIDQMKSWQKQWGYSTSSEDSDGMMNMSH